MPATLLSATTAGLVQLGVLLLLLVAVYVPFGNYLAAVYSDGKHWHVERVLYRVVRVDPGVVRDRLVLHRHTQDQRHHRPDRLPRLRALRRR